LSFKPFVDLWRGIALSKGEFGASNLLPISPLSGKRYAALLAVFSLMSRETILNQYGHEQK